MVNLSNFQNLAPVLLKNDIMAVGYVKLTLYFYVQNTAMIYNDLDEKELLCNFITFL